MKHLGRWNADDRQLAEGAPHAFERDGARLAPHDQLRDERVVVECDLVALLDPTVPPHPGAAGNPQIAHDARRGEKVVERVLRGDATLDCVAPRLQCTRVHAQRLAHRHTQLLAHDIHPIHELGHRVLDLNPGIHLQEVELATRREQEFDGPGPQVAHGARGGGGGIAHAAAQCGRHGHGRRFLDELLVPALDAALALAQRDHASERVRQDLDFDVSRPLEVFFEVHFAGPERLDRLARRRLESRFELRLLPDQPHALAAAARGRLEEHRVAEPCRLGPCLHVVSERPRGPRNDRHARLLHAAPRFGLVAHRRHRLRERRALREEAISGVHRLAGRALRRGNQLSDVEIGLGRRRGPERHGEVGGAHVRRQAIGLGIDRHRLEAFLVAGADDPQGDLAAVGDEDAFDGRHDAVLSDDNSPPRSTL